MKQPIGVFATLLLLTFSLWGQVPATAKEALFDYWNYSGIGVFGLIKLDNPVQRSYYKIWKPDLSTAKIQQYDSSGILVHTTIVRYVKGKLSQIARTDRWGDTYETTNFLAAVKPGQFSVTAKSTGRNTYLPAKGANLTYINNLLTEFRYISYANKLTSVASGAAIIRYKRYSDKYRFSLVKEMTFFDENDKPVISKSNDCHKIVYEYDERGNQTSVAYYGIDNEPLTNRFGGFKTLYQYNSNDKLTRSTVIGLNDEPVNNAYGTSGTVYDYRNGLVSKSIKYDAKNNIVRASAAGDGVAIIKFEHDERGNEIQRSYFDEKDNPMNSQMGYHRSAYTYTPIGMLASAAYYDRVGGAATNTSGIHRYVYARDEKGRVVETGYYGKDGKPVKDDFNQVFMVKYKYDEFGRDVATSYWETTDKKMDRWDGFHESIDKYNDDGQLIDNLYYDQNGKLFLTKGGYSRFVINYDTNARISERKWFKGETPATVIESFAEGFHSIKSFYDDSGRLSNLRYFDQSGNPVNATIDLETPALSVHKVEFIYKANRIVEQRLYTVNSDVPGRIIDCLKNDYVSTSGLSKGRKNQ